jgi:metal-responsive CopG/Arc/MetJ family transcriptional regulator
MGRRTKVTISIDADALEQLDAISRSQGITRSRLIEDAIRLLRRRLLEEQLAEGYRAMAEEDRECAEAFLAASVEALR